MLLADSEVSRFGERGQREVSRAMQGMGGINQEMERQNLRFVRKGGEETLAVRGKDGVPFLSFPALERTGLVVQGFSTRLGGVSSGDCATMNFAPSRGDTVENVRENYRRMGAAMGFDPERLVLSWQTHTTNIRVVTEKDAGKGYARERDYRDVDGLVTDVPGITLVTLYADCVPLFLLDPVRRVIGASHSGWRGTVARMGQRTVEVMRDTYGCDPKDMIAAIGPSICGDCYEVSADVAEAFMKEFPPTLAQTRKQAEESPDRPENGLLWRSPADPTKYQLNLQEVNRRILQESGILPEQIITADICTCCNRDLLFSHRGSHGRRGNMAGFLMLREDEA